MNKFKGDGNMKRKLLAIGLVSAMIASAVVGCDTKKEESKDDTKSDSVVTDTADEEKDQSEKEDTKDKDSNEQSSEDEKPEDDNSNETPSEDTPDENTDASESQVKIQWAESALNQYSDYYEYDVDNTEAQVKILLSTEKSLNDFKVLKLSLNDMGENADISFSTEELYSLDKLTPERPLVLGMTFFGTIPSYGISYVDANGYTKTYAISQSGMDGSLMLIDIDVKN